MLIPSLVAVLLWFGASGYLVFQGFYNREVALTVRKVSIPAVSALSSIQQERRLSIDYLTRPSTGLSRLLDQRRQTDDRVADLLQAANGSLGQAPDSIKTRWATLTGLLDQLAPHRSAIDSRSGGLSATSTFYNSVLDSAIDLFDTQARTVPDVAAALGGLTATEVFRASDMMSRASSTIDIALTANQLSQSDYLTVVRQISSYHFALDTAASHLEPAVMAQYRALQQDSEWQQLAASENEIVAGGSWRQGKPGSLNLDHDHWALLTAQISGQLINLSVGQADKASQRGLDTGNTQLTIASLGSLLALIVAGAAIVWALRQSSVLVDRALSVRLARLGSDAGTLVDEKLPAIMDRLRRREQVDLAAEFAGKDYGRDEIGQVAAVINRSLQAAAGAAVDEAKARAAGTAMLMGVARRPQRPLQRGLKVVEEMQSNAGDEKLLTDLFDIHHQLNQTRRFLENLVILAGGQTGRRFQRPMLLRRVLLAAFAEARDYRRITLRSAVDVSLVGHAVAEVIHVVSELLDNALSFSPPESTVWVSASRVNHGVAIEIEDAGVGMSATAVEQANTLLATAPTPDVTELKDGAQIGLHVVAELAKRENVQVSLRRSAYGGLLAIVLLPEPLLAFGPAEVAPADSPQPVRPGRPSPPPVRDDQWATIEMDRVDNRAAVDVLEPPPPPAMGRPMTLESAPIPNQRNEGSVSHKPPLPHRQPQQHLAPELRDDTRTDAGASSGAISKARSPEQARARFARYQQGRAAGAASIRDETVADVEQGREQ